MQNACPNPGCDAVYNLSPQHVGRQFACRKCAAQLFVDSGGLRLTDTNALRLPDAAPSAEPNPPQRAPAPASSMGQSIPAPSAGPRPHVAGFMGTVMGDLFTWVFGLGALLVVFFTFMPVLDAQSLARHQGKISGGELEQSRLDRELSDAKSPDAKRLQERKDLKEKWDKQKKELDVGLQEKRIGNARSHYWYTWGLLLGFLALAVAALGYMTPGQTPVRRVTGSIVICGLVLLIFLFVIIQSFGLTIRSSL